MSRYKHRISFFLIVMSVAVCAAQSRKEKKATKDYFDFAYSSAIDSYERLVNEGYTNQEVYEILGNANYLNANYAEAANWYERLFDIKNVHVEEDYLFRYAQCLKSLKKYEESNYWMSRFNSCSGYDGRAERFTQNKDYLKDIENQSGKYRVELAKFNSKVSDFAPSIFKNELVFTSARDTGLISRHINEWNNGAFLDLYKVENEKDNSFVVKRFSEVLNAVTHESSSTFTKDGKTIYFTRNNSDQGKKFSRDEHGVSRLKIMRATFVDGKWGDITELPFNDESYSAAHPTLNASENRLYFSSNMPGTFGASDIYYVDIYSDGTYGPPFNLGKEINTESRETFPFISGDDVLYFASDGHPGLGGLDIFAVDIKKNAKKSKVTNLGEPINSNEDDFSLVLEENKEMGYFTSNREGGIGGDDIYSFSVLEPLIFKCYDRIVGLVRDSETGEYLSDVSIQFVVGENWVTGQTLSDTDGNFHFELNCNQDADIVVVSKTGYQKIKIELQTESTNEILLTKVPEDNK